jgi:hypothetical protein
MMGNVRTVLKALFLSCVAPLLCVGQCNSGASGCASDIPHLVRFTGQVKTPFAASHTGIVTLRFTIYDSETGGTALWQEVQNTQADLQGHYEVLLGASSSEGVPLSVFSNGGQRWLGVQVLRPGSEEEQRVALVSVPYAVKAGDAQTLGGLPASAFLRTPNSSEAPTSVPVSTPPPTPGSSTSSQGTQASRPGSGVLSAQSPSAMPETVGTPNQIPRFATQGLADSQISDSAGVVTLQNLSNILFADRFPNGVPDAIAACPANGCIIYALSPQTNRNLGTIDPGNKAVTIYLGPYSYNVNQITLRKAMKIIGMGASGGNGTALHSVNGNNPVFVISQTNFDPTTNVLLSGFRVYGSDGNTTQDGFFLDTSSSRSTGLWYSTLDDIVLQGFGGISIHIKGRNDNFGSGSQWLLFNNVIVFRKPGGGNALRLEGATFELRFRNCEFDGHSTTDGTNIFIGGLDGGVTGYPISIVFEGLVSQNAALAVQIDGGFNLTFYASHHELLQNGYQVVFNHGVPTRGLTITDSYFAGNVGNNAGAGYDLAVESSTAQGIVFSHNQIFGAPDAVVKGTNLASVVYQDNLYLPGSSSVPPTSHITAQITPAATLDIRGIHTIGLNPSPTPIKTLQSSLGPGETVTFYALKGSVVFAHGGNIDLMGIPSLTVSGSITFIRTDLGPASWRIFSQWTPGVAH